MTELGLGDLVSAGGVMAFATYVAMQVRDIARSLVKIAEALAVLDERTRPRRNRQTGAVSLYRDEQYHHTMVRGVPILRARRDTDTDE